MNEPRFEDSAFYRSKQAYFFTIKPNASGSGVYSEVLFPNGGIQTYDLNASEQEAIKQLEELHRGRELLVVLPEMFSRIVAERRSRVAKQAAEISEGDIVCREEEPAVRIRVCSLCDGYGSFEVIRKNGARDRRYTRWSGSILGYRKV